MFDAAVIRKDFPMLSRPADGKGLVYLDSTATSLKPAAVLQAMDEYYTTYGANVFRGIYSISERATAAYEGARGDVARFIHARDTREVVFTRNTDESISLIYYAWALPALGRGDGVVTTMLEHHANFVPWLELRRVKGIDLMFWEPDETGLLPIDALETLVSKKTKLVALTAASNVLGTLPPIGEIVKRVKRINPGCIVLVDAAQAAPHMPLDVSAWGADIVAFSAHKMLGPTGIGVLWGRHEFLEGLPPFTFGGDMIKEVHRDRAVYQDVPHRFEAGTPYIAGAIGLGAAVRYLEHLGMEDVRRHEMDITAYALKKLQAVDGVTVYGPRDPKDRGGVVAFRLEGIHPHDVAQVLDDDRICVRVGFHCAQPLHECLHIGPTVRASFYIYTTEADIDALIQGLLRVQETFR
ncbi:SufS family cysteine desulfurase [Patescibacteria group bacterium]|nr:SufS family cysteine desulfurase [Patescibacteria group bacterium]